MPEKLLDRTEVGATFEQVSRVRVPQPVRVRDDSPQRARVETTAVRRDEERIVRPARERRPPVPQEACKPMCSLLAERDDAFLASLAPDVHRLLSKSTSRRSSATASALRSPHE